MHFGLVTYMWGADWTVPTLIEMLVKSQLHGVELRTEHAHGVESHLTADQRRQVRESFEESGITLVGLGCNWDFHHTDPAKLKANIESAKDSVRLSHDVGGSGVKVKPNALPPEVPAEKTIEQIGRSLAELADFAEGFGQEIRLEVHGRGTSSLPVVRQIMDIADHPGAVVCWNSNPADLEGEGLEHNFNLVRDHLGATVHVHELNTDNYPYPQLFKLLKKADYSGWVLLEARGKPADPLAALIEQRKLFEKMTG